MPCQIFAVKAGAYPNRALSGASPLKLAMYRLDKNTLAYFAEKKKRLQQRQHEGNLNGAMTSVRTTFFPQNNRLTFINIYCKAGGELVTRRWLLGVRGGSWESGEAPGKGKGKARARLQARRRQGEGEVV